MPLTLLVVDDDELDRMAVRRALRRARLDADVDERLTAEAALEAVQARQYDCILLDYRLPGATGVDVLTMLGNAGVRVPVVCLTGQGDEEVAVAAMKAGAADYLNKSKLTADRLERSIRYAIAIHRAEREREDLLEREQQAREEAQAANRAKDEFLATLSHELRTPLNAILGWARLLAAGQLDEGTAQRAVEIIERNSRIQLQLIEDLLDISRIITGKLRLESKRVTVRSVVEGALESVRHAAEARRITITSRVDPDDLSLVCDPGRMQQVTWNLLTNAIKFTPEGGQVDVTAMREGDMIAINVTDTGIGIAPAFLPYAFDRFRQQDGAHTREYGGLGIGLAIVRHLAELHGGHVAAFSGGEGRGSTFTVRLPVGQTAAPV
ncbi:MAG TPA: ATP-binding protein [Vicinamibacterales bacterium]|jgi:signal transduction histidine kinase|nr:ATP-binding protein [Vicinamibacterales bacterium]